MRLKQTIRISFLVVIACGIFLVLRSSGPQTEPKTKAGTCTESMEDCCQQDEKGGKTDIQNLTHQFFSTF